MNKIQFGKMVAGDFSENTITFEISKDSEMVLQAGKYAIVPIDEFNKLSELAKKVNASESKFAISDVSNWVAVKDALPDNDNQVFVKYENGKYGINEWWEKDNRWLYQFDNMIVKEWCKPPL